MNRPADTLIGVAALLTCCVGAPGCQGGSLADQLNEAGGPQIYVANLSQHLGEIPADTVSPYRHKIRLENPGTEPLVISSVTVSCGCADASLDRETINPGRHATLCLDIKRPLAEERCLRVTICSNDSLFPVLEPRVCWRVVAPLEAKPGSLNFGDLRRGQTRTQRLNLFCQSQSIAQDLTVSPSSKCLTAALAGYDKHGDGTPPRLLSVSVLAGGPAGNYWERVTIGSTGAGRESVTIPVEWRVREAIEASPAALFFGCARPGTLVKKSLVISVPQGETLEIADFRLEGPIREAADRRRSPSAIAFSLEMCYPSGLGEHRWTAKIHCLKPQEETIAVDVHAVTIE